MKSVLYVAATLMIGASIYGFVDYSKTSHRKEFKTMYDEPDVKRPVVTEEKTKTEIVTPEETVNKKELAVVTTEEPAQKPVKKIKKKRTIDVESFSRAPLREREEIIVPVKKESKVKEQ